MTEEEIASARANAYGGAGNTQNICIFRNHGGKSLINYPLCMQKRFFLNKNKLFFFSDVSFENLSFTLFFVFVLK